MKHANFPWLPLEAALQYLTLKIIFEWYFRKRRTPSVPNYKLSINPYIKEIFWVFQEIMMSQKSDRAIFALMASYAAYIDNC